MTRSISSDSFFSFGVSSVSWPRYVRQGRLQNLQDGCQLTMQDHAWECLEHSEIVGYKSAKEVGKASWHQGLMQLGFHMSFDHKEHPVSILQVVKTKNRTSGRIELVLQQFKKNAHSDGLTEDFLVVCWRCTCTTAALSDTCHEAARLRKLGREVDEDTGVGEKQRAVYVMLSLV